MNHILKALILCLSFCTWTSNTCTMARVISPDQALVPLKNGTFAPAQLTFNTHLSVTMIINNHQCFAVRELLENCMSNSSQPVSDEAGRILLVHRLVTQDYKPVPTLVNILKSMVRGQGERFAIISPVNHTDMP